MRPPRLILVCGLPGAGKTTLARQIAEQVPAVRLCPDEWLLQLGIGLRAGSMRDRLESLFWDHAQVLLRLGQSVILESGFWRRSDRDQKRLGARALGVAVELHVLNPPIDELLRRIHQRNQRDAPSAILITREELELWAGSFQVPDGAELAMFDPPIGDSADT